MNKSGFSNRDSFVVPQIVQILREQKLLYEFQTKPKGMFLLLAYLLFLGDSRKKSVF